MAAETGIQGHQLLTDWIALHFTPYPAFAGMTGIWAENSPTAQLFIVLVGREDLNLRPPDLSNGCGHP